jgi:hypothetical protein
VPRELKERLAGIRGVRSVQPLIIASVHIVRGPNDYQSAILLGLDLPGGEAPASRTAKDDFKLSEGAEGKYLGALLLGYYDRGKLRYAGKVGTGFDTRMLAKLHPRLLRRKRARAPFADVVTEKGVTWVTPSLVAQIKFSEWTHDGHLRQPVFLGLREDKPARKVVKET